jgi:hypothetical protein
MSTEPNKQEFVSPLTEHLRQYQHNDCSGIVFGYDKAGIDKLFASLNKQPPAEAGEGVVAWMHMDGNEVITNAAYVKVNDVFKCLYFPLYTSQTTATQAAVAAAMREFAEVLLAEIKANYGTASVSDGPLWHSIVNNSIPAEATAALDAYEALKLDAERYRWLKENYHGFEQYRSGVVPYITLDSEVDAAIVRDVLNKNREE